MWEGEIEGIVHAMLTMHAVSSVTYRSSAHACVVAIWKWRMRQSASRSTQPPLSALVTALRMIHFFCTAPAAV